MLSRGRGGGIPQALPCVAISARDEMCSGIGRGWQQNLYCKQFKLYCPSLACFQNCSDYEMWKKNNVNKHTECCVFSFMWEKSEDDLQAAKTKILALNKSHELFVYEITVEDGKYNPISLHSCKEDTLKKLLELKNISE